MRHSTRLSAPSGLTPAWPTARGIARFAGVLLLALASAARAQPPAPTAQPAATPAAPPSASTAAAQPVWQPDNRFTISGDGATLTDEHGGGGGSVGYLHEINANTLLGVAGEYQSLAGSHWEFGSLSAAYSHALTQATRWDISGEAHEGSGDSGQSGSQRFGYAIEALDAGLALPATVSVNVEERQIDVYTSHGSLPKAGLSKAWGTHWLTSVAYAQSVGGNLATEYALARVDFLSAPVQVLGGASVGHVAPAVLDLDGILLPQARRLTEVFLGLTKPTRAVDVSLLADRIDLQGIERLTLTLTATVHLR